MLQELFYVYSELKKSITFNCKRYLFEEINWDNRAICVYGARGVGKTTLLLQHCIEKYNNPQKCLYFSADNISVINYGLYKIAIDFFQNGGEALIIDEVHKYPNWSLEIKNIIDIYKNKKIIISGSSMSHLMASKYDLSRRIVYYELKGVSFREYLNFNGSNIKKSTLNDIIDNHVALSLEIKEKVTVIKEFKEYLTYGYYPYYLEGTTEYLHKLRNVIEKILYEDISTVLNLSQAKLPVLKKILWLIATSSPFEPNIEQISSNLQTSKEYIYNYLEALGLAGLIANIYVANKGSKIVQKPSKIFLDNTNLIHAINGKLNFEAEIGAIRETFFINQLTFGHKINTHITADFLIDETLLFEIGGKNKSNKQIKELENAYILSDNIEIGFGNKIPLYLFGLLY